MRSTRTSPSRSASTLLMMALTAACAAVFAAPAAATPSTGDAVIRTADHDRGRTLSGQGGKLVSGIGTSAEGRDLTLPVPELDPKAGTASHSGNLAFRKGGRGVALAGIHFDFKAGTLNGLLGGEEMAVFKLGAHPHIDPVTGTAQVTEGVLRFTPEAAEVVREKLGLERALRHNGVGMLWLYARANPTHETKPVTGGGIEWGVLEGWRSYILGFFGPGSTGTITTAGGATSSGDLSEAGGFFTFPAATGSFEKGLYGAGDRLSLRAAGSVTFAKPGHCIIEVKFSEIDVSLNGADSLLSLDSIYDIDTPPGCVDNPPVATDDVPFAKLDLSAVAPVYSADGGTITWPLIPATLTAQGGEAWGAGYEAGDELDPVTITAALG